MGSESIHVIAESEWPEGQFTGLDRDIKLAIQQRMGLLIAKAVVVPPKWLIKTTSGKMSRWSKRDKYLNPPAPEAVQPMTKQPATQPVKAEFLP